MRLLNGLLIFLSATAATFLTLNTVNSLFTTQAAVSSCSASVSPISVGTDSTTNFGFTLNNTSSSTIVWIKVSVPSANFTITGYGISGWVGSFTNSFATFGGGTLGPSSMDFSVTATTGSSEAPSANWTVQVSDDSGGASPTSCTGSLGTTISGDTTPPTISNLAASSITDSSIRISWATNEPANSVVLYGTTEDYGQQKTDGTLTTSHALTLTGLSADTLYHYQVQSTDGSGNMGTSDDNTFATAKPGQVIPPPTPKTPPPTVTITTNLAKVFKTAPKIQGKVTDRVAVSKIEYSLDNGRNWIPVDTAKDLGKKSATFEFTPVGLTDGNYLIKVRATNPSGNIGTSRTVTLVIDLLPPRLGGNSFFLGPQKLFPAENGFLSISSGSQLSMVVSAVGGPIKVKVRVDAGVFSLQPIVGTNLWRGEIAFEKEGSFDLEATSTDGAGNIVTQKLTPILVSGKGKVTSLSEEPLGGAEVSLSVQVEGVWHLWEGGVFGQENPQRTDEGGNFRYLLPGGRYQLRVKGIGYREFVSEPFTVGEPTPINPTISLEPRPGLTIFGRRLTLPWFLDIFAQKRGITLELPTPTVEPTDLGVGGQASDFTLSSTLGGETNLKALKKRKVLITFWTTWDPLSVEQIVILDKLSAPRGVVLLPVALQESPGRVASFLGRGNYLLPSLVDKTGAILKKYRVLSIPQHFLIGKDGRIEDVRVGVLSAEEVLELVE